MAISSVGGFQPFIRPNLGPTGGQPSVGGAMGAGGVGGTNQASFGDQLTNALDSVEQSQQIADGLAQQASTGTLSDVHDYMIAATQAQLATELTVAVRNKALESFNEIMHMQV